MSLTDPVRPSGYFAYGYHATTAERAGKIQRDQRIEPTAEDTHGHWLGYGAYFWQDAPTWAWQWLNRTYNRRRLRPAQNGRAVFVARIDLDHCLDFLDTRWNYIIRRAHRMLRELHAASGEPMPTQSWNPQSPKWNDLDCAVIALPSSGWPSIFSINFDRSVPRSSKASPSTKALHSTHTATSPSV
jgi:hypothetical protein